MSKSHWIIDLHSIYPEKVWAWTIVAFLEEPALFHQINTKRLLQNEIIKTAKDNKPIDLAHLAWVELHQETTLDEIIQSSQKSLPISLQNRVKKTMMDYFSGELADIKGVKTAGLLALNYWENFRVENNWDALINQTIKLKGKFSLVLACLLGMVSSPDALFSELFKKKIPNLLPDMVVKAYLMNPVSPETRCDFFYSVMEQLSLTDKYLLIQLVAEMMPPVGKLLSEKSELKFNPDHIKPNNDHLKILSSRIAEIEFNSITSDVGELPEKIKKLLDLNKSIQGEMENLLGTTIYSVNWKSHNIPDHLSSPHDAFQSAIRSDPTEPIYMANLVSDLLDKNLVDEAKGWLEAFRGDQSHPMINFQWARILWAKSDFSKAYQSARLALLRIANLNKKTLLRFSIELASFFLSAGYPEDAFHAILPALRSHSTNTILLWLSSITFKNLGDNQKSLEAIASASAASLVMGFDTPPFVSKKVGRLISNQSPDFEKFLIEGIERCSDWDRAFRLRKTRLSKLNDPSIDELISFASTALRVDEPETCLETLQIAIKKDPDNPDCYELMGDAFKVKNNPKKAIENYRKAIKLDPEHISARLTLADLYEESNQYDKALEALRSAALLFPDSEVCQFALGSYCLDHNAPTQAIPPLQKAAKLAIGQKIEKEPKSSHAPVGKSLIALKLGKALIKTGHAEEGHQVLKAGFESIEGGIESYPDISYAYAQSLVDSGDYFHAIPLLEYIIQIQPELTQAYLDLAQALIDLPDQPEAAEQAIPYLKVALSHPVEPVVVSQIHTILADALVQAGRFEEAQFYYQSALNSSLSKSISWQGRISYGLGRTRLNLQQPEAAIVALHEAKKINPGNIEIYRWLAEAYLSANLVQDSWETAKNLVQQSNQDLETTLWFADHSIKLNNLPKIKQVKALPDAVRILLRHIQKNPGLPVLWFKLGQIHLLGGEFQAAKAAFEQLEDTPAETSESQTQKVDSLLQAADSLEEFGHREEAIQLLDQAYHLSWLATEKLPSGHRQVTSPYDILSLMGESYYRSGDLDASINVFKKATLLEPNKPEGYLRLSELLFEKDMPFESLSCLEKASEVSPDNPEILSKIIWMELETGNLQEALDYLDQTIRFTKEVKDEDLRRACCYQAAEISRSLLFYSRASEYLSEIELVEDDLVSLSAALLRAELNASQENYDAIKADLNFAQSNEPDHPRLMSLKVLLDPEHTDPKSLTTLNTYLDEISLLIRKYPGNALDHLQIVGTLRSISEAALSMKNWTLTLLSNRALLNLSKFESLVHIQKSRIHVLMAEFQRFCTSLDLRQHAPGSSARNDRAFHEFLSAIDQALRRFSDSSQEPLSVSKKEKTDLAGSEIEYWRKRGMVVFKPDPQNIKKAEMVFTDAHGMNLLLLALRELNDDAAIVNFSDKVTPESDHPAPEHLLHLALALENSRPWEALEKTCQAIDNLQIKGILNTKLAAYCLYLLARLTAKVGGKNRLEISPKEAVEKALLICPDEAEWHASAAKFYIEESNEKLSPTQLNLAKTHLEKAVDLEPDAGEYQHAMGELELQLGNISEAVNRFKTASTLDPDNPASWLELAKIQFQIGELEKSAKSVDRSLNLLPDFIDALLLKGELTLLSGNPRGAQSKAQAVFRIDPDNLIALQLHARSLNALGHTDEALQIMAKVISQVEKPLPLELERSQWYCQSDPSNITQLQKGLVEVRRLSDRYPQEPRFKAILAELLMKSGQFDAAIVTARQALQDTDFGLPQSDESNLHLMLGKYYRNSGQLDNAIHHLKSAVDAKPTNLDAHLELGLTYQERRQYSDAFKVFQSAIHISPEDYRSYYFAGMVSKEAKDYQNAEEMLRKASELSPEDPTINRQFGAVVALNLVHNHRTFKSISVGPTRRIDP